MLRAEIPPTAGLPARFGDFWALLAPRAGRHRLENAVAKALDLPDLQAECSGSACLMLALKALQKLGPGRDEVVIPAYNCPLVPLAIVQCGLRPVLCDTAAGGFDFEPAALRRCVSARTLAVIPTHLGGQAADAAAAKAVAQSCGAYVIEDAAQSLGAPKAAGIGRHGDIVFYSLAAGKGLTLYEGGLMSARAPALRAALRAAAAAYAPQKPLWEARRLAELFAYCCFYRPRWLGLFYGLPKRRALARGEAERAAGDVFSLPLPLHRLSNARAACGLAAAQRLPQFLQQVEAQAAKRLARLRQMAEASGGRLALVGAERAEQAAWPFFMLLLRDKRSRDALLARLWALPDGAGCLFVRALGDYAYLKPLLGAQNSAPNARNFAERLLTISNSLFLSNSRFEKLCHIIEQALLAEGENR